MTHQLGALTVLTEDWASIPSTHIVAHNSLQFQFQRIIRPLLAASGTAGRWYPDIHAGKTPTHIKINKSLKEKGGGMKPSRKYGWSVCEGRVEWDVMRQGRRVLEMWLPLDKLVSRGQMLST